MADPVPVVQGSNLGTPLKRGEKYSILPAYLLDGYMAWIVKLGSIKTTELNIFMRRLEVRSKVGGKERSGKGKR